MVRGVIWGEFELETVLLTVQETPGGEWEEELQEGHRRAAAEK
jgi:hypothetical protein